MISKQEHLPKRGNVYDNVVFQFNKAADLMGLDPDIRKILARTENEITVNFPVRMDDGRVEIFTGHRIQHNNALGPFKGGLRYHTSVDCDEVSIVFAGDSGPSETVVAGARGADVLVVNCWDHQDTMAASGEADGQTGTRDAAEMAQDAGVGKVICTHIGAALAAPGSRERGIAEVAALYEGEIIFSEELMVVEL